ncbi:MAG: hypothetical protein QG671_4029 [Actinomycetota bacterium]|nr:hypothetical protein [Actinomycetota bacterium]
MNTKVRMVVVAGLAATSLVACSATSTSSSGNSSPPAGTAASSSATAPGLAADNIQIDELVAGDPNAARYAEDITFGAPRVEGGSTFVPVTVTNSSEETLSYRFDVVFSDQAPEEDWSHVTVVNVPPGQSVTTLAKFSGDTHPAGTTYRIKMNYVGPHDWAAN